MFRIIKQAPVQFHDCSKIPASEILKECVWTYRVQEDVDCDKAGVTREINNYSMHNT